MQRWYNLEQPQSTSKSCHCLLCISQPVKCSSHSLSEYYVLGLTVLFALAVMLSCLLRSVKQSCQQRLPPEMHLPCKRSYPWSFRGVKEGLFLYPYSSSVLAPLPLILPHFDRKGGQILFLPGLSRHLSQCQETRAEGLQRNLAREEVEKLTG